MHHVTSLRELVAGMTALRAANSGHGDRKIGIQQLGIAAERGHDLPPFAKILLHMAALRERETGPARMQRKELVAELPENPFCKPVVAGPESKRCGTC